MPVIRARDGGDSACDCARLKQSGPVAQRLEQWTHNAFRGSARSCTALQSLTKSPTFPRNRLSCSARSRTETHARPRPSDTTSDTRISEVGEGPKPPPAVLGAHHPCDETSINRIVAVTRARITRYATDEYSPPSGEVSSVGSIVEIQSAIDCRDHRWVSLRWTIVSTTRPELLHSGHVACRLVQLHWANLFGVVASRPTASTAEAHAHRPPWSSVVRPIAWGDSIAPNEIASESFTGPPAGNISGFDVERRWHDSENRRRRTSHLNAF